jgi:transposase-like protein
MTTKSPWTIKFNKPTYRTFGKTRVIVVDDEPIYTSKCGRFRIEKHMMAGGRNGYFNDPEYRVFSTIADESGEKVEKRLGTFDTYRDARGCCEMEINPDWEGY